MRILKFIVEGQTLSKDPECDFSHIIKGSKDYLGCSFKLPADWRNIPLAATFTHYGKEICASPVFSGACWQPRLPITGKRYVRLRYFQEPAWWIMRSQNIRILKSL